MRLLCAVQGCCGCAEPGGRACMAAAGPPCPIPRLASAHRALSRHTLPALLLPAHAQSAQAFAAKAKAAGVEVECFVYPQCGHGFLNIGEEVRAAGGRKLQAMLAHHILPPTACFPPTAPTPPPGQGQARAHGLP